jgi:DNA-binding transcriptional MocR family regulator
VLHISKACPPAYKVFFAGARGGYMTLNECIWDWFRSLKAAARGSASMLCQ